MHLNNEPTRKKGFTKKRLTCIPVGRKCSFTQLRKVFACISTQRSSLPRIFMPLAAVPSGLRATRPACVIFCVSVVPSELCFKRPAWVILAPFRSLTSMVPTMVMRARSTGLGRWRALSTGWLQLGTWFFKWILSWYFCGNCIYIFNK